MALLSTDINVKQIVSIKRYEAVELSQYDSSYRFTPQKAIIKRRLFGPNVTRVRPAGYTTRDYFRSENIFTSSEELAKNEAYVGRVIINVYGEVYLKCRLVLIMSSGGSYTKWFDTQSLMEDYHKFLRTQLTLSTINKSTNEKA